MTHPVCVALRQVGMCWKLPPTSAPMGTCTFPPRMMAETIRFLRVDDGSTWARKRSISMAAPCECPMNTMGLPSS